MAKTGEFKVTVDNKRFFLPASLVQRQRDSKETIV